MVVIGSGFGGGIVACRLAEAGRAVCVLERGRRFAREDFIERPEQAPSVLFHEKANPGGLFDVRMMRDVTVITAAGVGGGSLVYANVQLRAPPEVFDRGWPAAIDRQMLDPWYDRTEDALQPRVTPSEPKLPKVGAFAAAGRRAGKTAELMPIAVHFGDPREHPFSGVRQEGCQNLGRCDLGCPVHAKNTVDITYVARAEHARRGGPPAAPGDATSIRRAGPAGAGASASATSTRATAAPSRRPPSCWPRGTLGHTRLLLHNRKRLHGALAGARQPLLRQRRRAGDRLRPAGARRPRAPARLRPGDDQQARLHGRPPADRRRRRAAGRTSASCSTSPAAST